MSLRQVNDTEVKERNPFGVWGLGLITLGIYSLVWYYKVNKEMRNAYGINVDPAMTVLALTLGALLLGIPPLVAVYKTGRRIEETQQKAGIQDRISPVASFFLGFVFGLNVVYMQSNLNKVWQKDAASLPQGEASGGQLPASESQPESGAGAGTEATG